MKTNIMIGALALMFATSANAGLLDGLMTGDWDEIDPSAQYKLETYGFNIRVYEWIPADNPNVRCVFAAGNENSTGVACYDVEVEDEYQE